MTIEEITQKMDRLERAQIIFIIPIIILFVALLISGITSPSTITLILLGLTLLACLPIVVISVRVSLLAELGAKLAKQKYEESLKQYREHLKKVSR